MKTYGFGIIGCGMISDFHSAAISELEHGQLVAVSSRNAENAKRLTDRYNVDSYTDYAEMLKRDDSRYRLRLYAERCAFGTRCRCRGSRQTRHR